MADPMTAYQKEVKRMHDTYGRDAEIPHPPTTGVPGPWNTRNVAGAPIGRPPIAARIEDLANQIAIAGHQVSETRQAYERASIERSKAESRFADLANALVQTIHEHREGTPENVAYQPGPSSLIR